MYTIITKKLCRYKKNRNTNTWTKNKNKTIHHKVTILYTGIFITQTVLRNIPWIQSILTCIQPLRSCGRRQTFFTLYFQAHKFRRLNWSTRLQSTTHNTLSKQNTISVQIGVKFKCNVKKREQQRVSIVQ